MIPQPLPPGYYSSPGRCPVCSKILVETDRVDDTPVYSCRSRCGQDDAADLARSLDAARQVLDGLPEAMTGNEVWNPAFRTASLGGPSTRPFHD